MHAHSCHTTFTPHLLFPCHFHCLDHPTQEDRLAEKVREALGEKEREAEEVAAAFGAKEEALLLRLEALNDSLAAAQVGWGGRVEHQAAHGWEDAGARAVASDCGACSPAGTESRNGTVQCGKRYRCSFNVEENATLWIAFSMALMTLPFHLRPAERQRRASRSAV